MPKPRQKRHWHWLKTGQLYRLTLIVTSICIPLCSNASGTVSHLTAEIYSTAKSNNNNTRSQLHTPIKQITVTKVQELEQQNLQATRIKLTHTHQNKHKLTFQPTQRHEGAPSEHVVLAQKRNRPNVELNLPTPAIDTAGGGGDVAHTTKTNMEKHTHVAYSLQETPTYDAILGKEKNVSDSMQADTQAVNKINFSRSSMRISANWPQNNLKVNQVFESQRRMTTAEIRRNSRRIVLLGLFELSNRHGQRLDGWSELNAAKMAVEHINSKKILPDYTLELLTNDTQVSRLKRVNVSLKVYLRAMQRGRTKIVHY